MTKRKSREWTGREEPKEKPKAAPQIKVKSDVGLRSLWSTRLVIEPTRTVTGKRYAFEPGQVLPVSHLDAPGLLAMEKDQPPGCCGGDPNPPPRKYFEEA